MHTLTDLLGEQDYIHLSQVVLLICDSVKEFTTIHTARERGEACNLIEHGSQRTCLFLSAEAKELDTGEPKGDTVI